MLSSNREGFVQVPSYLLASMIPLPVWTVRCFRRYSMQEFEGLDLVNCAYLKLGSSELGPGSHPSESCLS